MNYRHLSQCERYQIEAGISLGMSIRSIAHHLGRHRSTIFRELKRNGHITREGYLGGSAHQNYGWRRQKCRPRFKIRGCLKQYVDARLRRKWSPEQIAGRRKLEARSSIGVETLYRYIYEDRKRNGSLWTHLRHRRARRRKRFQAHRWPQKVPRISAENRPVEANQRLRLGDFERDLIVGSGWSGYLLTVVDRKSRLLRLRKPRTPKSRHIHQLTVRSLRGLKVHTLTNDNGVEFQQHLKTAQQLGAPVYFTRPYASWERGTVENTNKLIRQYFPKKKNFKEITHAQVKVVQNALNQRPRKTLGFRTPLETHFEKRTPPSA